MSKILGDFIKIIKISQIYNRPPKNQKTKSKNFPISLSKNGENLPENNLLDRH
jgi:hypothetical protein